MDVLVYLAERASNTVSHHELLDQFWRGSLTSTNAVHKCIADLRRVFDGFPDAGARIETVPKRGYGLVASVERHEIPVGVSLQYASVENVAAAYEIRKGRRSALMVPMQTRVQNAERHLLATIVDKAVSRLRTTAGTSVQTVQIERPMTIDPNGVHDYAVDLEVIEATGRLHGSLAIVSSSAGQPSYHQLFDRPSEDRIGLIDELGANIADNLAVLLDDVLLAQMREWGTQNVHAYRLARQGEEFRRIQYTESLLRAEELFHQAIREDPTFSYAYLALTSVYWAIAQAPPDTATRERARRELQAVVRDAGRDRSTRTRWPSWSESIARNRRAMRSRPKNCGVANC